MKKKRFTEARIIAGLEDAEVAATAREVCHRRKHQRADLLLLEAGVQRHGEAR